MKNDSYPEIRFKGFKDAWEQRKVDDITSSYSGGTPQAGNQDYYNGDIPFIRSGEIYQSHTELFITQKGLNNSSAKMVSKGDILYALYGATSGEVSRSKLDGAINQAILAIHPKDDFNADFLVEWFRKEKDNIISRYLQGGQGNLSAQIIKNLDVMIPSSSEQKMIGDFFSNLNNLITLHQRKYEKLKNIKQSMLEKMFPKNGEKFPEIRFKGFTDAWEQRKLKDIASFIRGSFPQPYTNPDFYDENGGKPFVQVADIGMGLELNQDTKTHISRIAESKSRFVEAGTVIVALQGSIETSIGRTAITQYDAFVDRTILIFESYRIPIDKIFFAQSIKKLFQKEKEKAWGATISTITKEHLSDFILGIPSLDEQVKIGLFFKNIDNLITLHQRKLEKLKNIKKSMLGKMFV